MSAPRSRRGSPTWSCTTCSTCCSTTRAAGSTARRSVDIAALEVGEEATVIGEVRSVHGRRTRKGSALVEVVVHDGSSLLNVTFFNQAWREKQLAVGTEVSLFGKLDVYRGKRQMTKPGRRRGRPGRRRRRQDRRDRARLPAVGQGRGVHLAAARAGGARRSRSARPRGFADPLDEALLDRHDLVDRTRRAARDPPSGVDGGARAPRTGGSIFDEFLRMQVGLVARKRALAAEESGIRHTVDGPLVDAFLAQLPFALTGDQQRAIDEITHDMAGAAPMHRLLQGDVGSGKTVVALAALLVAVQGGYQGAFMAPTEVLAEQHYLGSVRLLEGLTVRRAGLAARRPAGAASSCSPTARPRPSAGASRRASTPARSTSSSARTRCSTATPSSPSSASR